ncbi:MAG TPA: M57 family metalloprotease [Flavisolibacter sp.]|nr:M57 family metalloprotease [Flavisolibacter sp.]
MLQAILRLSKAPLSICAILLVLLAPSCKKADLQQEQEITISKERIEELRNSIAASTGAPLAEVEYKAAERSFSVSNDALITVQDAEARFPQSANVVGGSSGSQQRVYSYTVSRTNATNIVCYADATVPAEWLTALDQAIANWNATNSLVVMKRVTAITTTKPGKGKKPGTTTTTVPEHDVLITTMYNNTSNVIAQAYYPSYDGSAGHKVQINTYYNYLNASYKTFAITHELGHTIGFTHTNQTYGSLIPGTPETDPNSVMNSTVLPWNGFTSYDVIAVRTIYPK